MFYSQNKSQTTKGMPEPCAGYVSSFKYIFYNI
jgi:hypothetical protein